MGFEMLNFLKHSLGGLCGKDFHKILKNSLENICARVSFLINLQAAPATLIKIDSGTDVFL